MLSSSSTKLTLLLTFLVLLLLVQAAAGQGGGEAEWLPAEGLAIDFDRVVAVPEEMRAPVFAAVKNNHASLSAAAYTVTVLEQHAGWAHLVLIPTNIYESHWELPLADGDIVDVIAYQDNSTSAWQAFLKDESNRALLEQIAPGQFAAAEPASPEELVYKFPWTSGQSWRVTQGWHQNGAIDFRPLTYSDPPVDGAVLAAEGGLLSSVCNDGYQALLRVDHGSVTTEYLHLDVDTLRPGDLNMLIPQGRYLGQLYNGNVFEDPHRVCVGLSGLQYSTPCGCGTGYHLHFRTSSTSIIMDGISIDHVATSGGSYTSSNIRDGGPTTVPFQVIVNPPAISPDYGGMCDSAWYRFSGYTGEDAYLTLNTDDPAQSTNSGQWVPSLPYAGDYRVDAYIANHTAVDWQCPAKTISGDTTEARYEVTHAGGTVTAARNQLPLANAWLVVGTYAFDAGSGGKVRLNDLNGETNLSRTISFSAMRFTLQAPDVPGGVSASEGAYEDKVRLAWSPVFGAQKYELYRATSLSGTKTKLGSPAATSFDDATATPGTTYYYWVTAVNPSGSSQFSAPESGWRAELPEGTALLAISPVRQEIVGIDAPVCVDVTVAQASDLGAFEFTLAFPPALLQATTASLGPFLGSSGRTPVPIAPLLDNTAGSITYGATSEGSAAGAEGSGVLATLCFDVQAAGEARLLLNAGPLADTLGQLQPVSLSDGSIGISDREQPLLFLPLLYR